MGEPLEHAVTISDPVVRVAMQAATDRISYASNEVSLADFRDRALVVQTLIALRSGGHYLDLDEIVAWAGANSWRPEAVKELRRTLAMLIQGRTPHGPRGAGAQLRPDALEIWRKEAGGRHLRWAGAPATGERRWLLSRDA